MSIQVGANSKVKVRFGKSRGSTVLKHKNREAKFFWLFVNLFEGKEGHLHFIAKQNGLIFIEVYPGADISRFSKGKMLLADMLFDHARKVIQTWRFGGSFAAKFAVESGSAIVSAPIDGSGTFLSTTYSVEDTEVRAFLAALAKHSKRMVRRSSSKER